MTEQTTTTQQSTEVKKPAARVRNRSKNKLLSRQEFEAQEKAAIAKLNSERLLQLLEYMRNQVVSGQMITKPDQDELCERIHKFNASIPTLGSPKVVTRG